MRRHRCPGRRAKTGSRAAVRLRTLLTLGALALTAALGNPAPGTGAGAGTGSSAATAAAAQESRPAVADGPTVLYLVRHGETAPDGTRNPPLSEEGRERARWLGVVLSHARLDAVYTTDYRRTRATARGAALANGVQLTVYDPTDLDALAGELRARGGRLLVVGHSNTTPALARALGGDPGSPIREDEFDRLYVLVIRDDSTRTVRLRY